MFELPWSAPSDKTNSDAFLPPSLTVLLLDMPFSLRLSWTLPPETGSDAFELDSQTALDLGLSFLLSS